MEYRPFYLGREWVKLGHNVTIVAASFSHLRILQPCLDGDLAEENSDGIRYVWLKTPAYVGNGIRRAWNMAVFVRQLQRYETEIVTGMQPDVVITSSPHPFAIFPARRIAEKHGATLIFEVRDLWPLTLIELNDMSSWHPFIQCLQYTENYAYRRADRVVSTLPKADRYMQAHGMAPEKFAYIGNGVCLDDWEIVPSPLPDGHAAFLSQLRREGRFIVGYVGGHQPSNALGAFIEAAGLLEHLPLTFVLVGHGSEKKRLERKAKDRHLTNIEFLSSIPRDCIPRLLDSMDALYLGLKSRSIFQYGISPNKLMDYMMAAKPVIHAVDAGNDLVVESDCGVSCTAEDPRAIADAVIKLLHDSPEERQAMGRRGKDYILQHHDYAVLASRGLDVIDDKDYKGV